MKTNKAVVVALAAAVLASGGGLAGSIVTATPAYAVEGAVTQPATTIGTPTNLQAYPNFTNGASVVWGTPTDVNAALIAGYTIIVKQTGKADRVITQPASAGTSITLSNLTGGTAYVVQVKTNIATSLGTTISSPAASVNLQTFYPLTTVKAVTPTVTVSGVTNNGVTATWKKPYGTVGSVTSYNLVLKQGTTVIKRVNVPEWSDNSWTGDNTFTTVGLKAGTAYTLEATANAVSYQGGNKAVSAKTSVKFTTAATATSLVKVTKPVLTLSGVTATKAVVGWNKPTVTGGSVVSYGITVTENSTGLKKAYSIASANASFTVPSLKANTAYSVEVIAKAVTADKRKTAYSSTTTTFTTKAR